MRSKAKQKFVDLGYAIERSGIDSSISDKHLSHSDERIISLMNSESIVGQTEVAELLSSSDGVTSVEIFDTPADHFKIEFVEESVEKAQTENIVLEDPLPPQHMAAKRRMDIEERRLAMEERKIAALETRNSIELRKADALEQNNALLSNILKKLDEILQK
ncbi:uncharacterized protein LOC118741731 isoform X2 [Rhagoletis pomonella]|nr:uncharacterized protein LOC118741731 isoform X2 [Rhagoletis pomonella]